VAIGLAVVGLVSWSFASAGILRLPGAKRDVNGMAVQGSKGAANLLVPASPNSPKLQVGAGGDASSGLAEGVQPGSPNLAVGSEGQPPSLAEPAEPGQPNLAVADGKLPDDVSDWLAHLKRCDQRRENLNSSLTKEFSGVPDDLANNNQTTPDELEGFLAGRENQVDALLERVSREFASLRTQFLSKKPPPACQSLANDYDAVLADTSKMFHEVSEAMRSLDIDRLMNMMGTSYGRIDRNIQSANRTVQRICDQYGVPNRYQLFVDKPGSGFGSMLGVGSGDIEKIKKQYKDLLGGDGG
jgi:hypothetical protein